MAEWELWLKSVEISCSWLVSKMFFNSDFEAFDNEWGFACRMCDLANYLGKI